MPIEFDGPNSKVSANVIEAQSGSTITIQSGHNLSGGGSGLTALPAANLTGTIAAISGANLTALNATQLTSGTIPIARIADDAVTTAKIAPDAITAAKIADDVINSEHYAAASIDNEHLADDAVGVAELSATGTASNTTFLRGDNAWAAAGGGGFKFLAHTRVLHTSGGSAVSAIEFDSSDGIDNTTYAGYLFHCTRMFPGNNGRVGMRVSDNDGSSWDASGYKCHLHSIDEDGLQQVGTSSSENTIRLCTNSNGNSAGFFGHCQVYIPVETLSHEYGFANIQGGWREDASSYDSYACYGSGAQTSGSAAGGWNAFQFLAESGNIAANITMYGMVKA